jgi:ketosteroid isomerase-like protein
MSATNVQIVRSVMEAFNRRDVESLTSFFDDGAEIVPVRAALEGTVYRGADAGAQYCAAIEDSWENLRWEVEEIRAGGDWVIALGRIQGRGRDSGVVIDARGGWVVRLREGLITSFQTFSERAKALQAVGLLE